MLESVGSSHKLAEDRFSIYQEKNSLGFLITEVEDDGSGIEQSKFQNLFQTFSMADKSELKTSGIGLGLTTVKKLTHSLQGAVSLKSNPSEGTSVTFSVLTRLGCTEINANDMLEQTQEAKLKYYLAIPAKHFTKLQNVNQLSSINEE